MPDHHEIDLQNLDRRTLTPELWGLIKTQAVRRANAERTKLMSHVLGRLAFWRRKDALRSDARANLEALSA
jgi:hypothetical protein